VPELVHGAGGMAWYDGKFIIVGGLPPGVNENYAYEYDENFRFVKRHVIASGYTLMGIQTIAQADGAWWFGCYGKPAVLLRADQRWTFSHRPKHRRERQGQPSEGLHRQTRFESRTGDREVIVRVTLSARI
jgi:hypothetical protein